jgi:hypothetical protein
LRLDFHVETPRGLETVQQEPAEGNVLDGRANTSHGADCRLELLDARTPGQPAPVGIGHGMVSRLKNAGKFSAR